MLVFVQRPGTWDIVMDSTSGTPTLEIADVNPGDLIKVTVKFYARTRKAGYEQGFYYEVEAVKPGSVKKLTSARAAFQNSPGWQAGFQLCLFEVTGHAPVTASFRVNFVKGDLAGKAQINDFLIIGEIYKR